MQSNRTNEGKFKPGISGNLKGRPKKGDAWADIANELLASRSIIITLTNSKGEKKKQHLKTTKSFRHAIILSQIKAAISGDTRAQKELVDRSEGRPAQTIVQKDSNKPDFTDLKFVTMKQ